jgi:O-acetylserine/cysteine efflux transporter
MKMSGNLTPTHIALATAVMVIWGTNFVVVKHALTVLPPLTLATLRFTAVLLPLVFFVKRPAVSWGNLAAYGVLLGAGQFGGLFVALRADVTPGLASVLIQSQVFFTIGLSMMLTGERPPRFQLAALGLAVVGLGIILGHTDGSITMRGLILLLIAALGCAGANIVARAAGRVEMLGYIIWASAFAIPPLLMLALIFEGWQVMISGIRAATAPIWGVVVWQAIGNTLFGYGVWGWLLARYPATTVAPLALMVPVFGMGSSALLLGEPMQSWKLLAAFLIIAALAIGMLWPRFAQAIKGAA